MMWDVTSVTDLALARYFVVVIVFIIIIVVILVRLRLVIFVALERAVRDVVNSNHGLKTTSLTMLSFRLPTSTRSSCYNARV